MSTSEPAPRPTPPPVSGEDPAEVLRLAALEWKLSSIRQLAKGAWVYLDPCAHESDVAEWERVHKVRLPEEYRRFLLCVGEGGEGPPQFGLWSLECQDPCDAEAFRGAFLERELQNSFPLESAWRWTPEEEAAYQRGCPEIRERVRLRGQGVRQSREYG